MKLKKMYYWSKCELKQVIPWIVRKTIEAILFAIIFKVVFTYA